MSTKLPAARARAGAEPARADAHHGASNAAGTMLLSYLLSNAGFTRE